MIVVDASSLLEVLLRTHAAAAIQRHLLAAGQSVHAPHLIDIEIAQVVRRFANLGEIDVDRGFEALSDLATFPLQRYPHRVLLPRVWELRSNFTAYDAVYVALAEALGAQLLTIDRKLATAVGRHTSVELLQSENGA